ncbi:hypothetical protein BDV28DRAFT_26941 [Aspergillus coremiiformis]|uniref:Uncharacterized protein n=1 Tax=Aspergillus coremiiformis TaxID=138285 RepID=A0A5N6ZFW6_9EURO|nr:hypothetical protein BDV28DRAFT_26941 [Aspergillus coremiiformis]
MWSLCREFRSSLVSDPMRFHISLFYIAIPSSLLVTPSLVYLCKRWNDFLLFSLLFDLCDFHRWDVARVISLTTVSSVATLALYLRWISYVLLLLLYHLIAICRVFVNVVKKLVLRVRLYLCVFRSVVFVFTDGRV